tara:strand:+ start:118 stop:594 length:477 start_codon:yes stop_codon:yes gene_type:complete
MATVFSNVRTDLTQDDPKEFVKANQLGGSVRVAHATFEASSLASGDVIEMFALPQGARVLGGYLYNDALGSSTTLSVGHSAHTNGAGASVAADADEYLAATSTSSAARTDIAATLALSANTVVDISQSVIDNEFVVTATMGGAAGTGTIELMMMYVVD